MEMSYITNDVSKNAKHLDVINNAGMTSKASADLIESNKDVLSFPSPSFISKAGWICNVSQDFKFSQVFHEYLQIAPNKSHDQFSLICRLLRANNCRVIYFDDNFTLQQLATIRRLQRRSQTKLFNAKMAFLFSDKISALSA